MINSIKNLFQSNKQPQDYQYYFNKKALNMVKWGFEELYKNNNRIKANKIKKISNKLEFKYRYNNGYPLNSSKIKFKKFVEYATNIDLIRLNVKLKYN
jgi:hypothetical protein